jgi:DNA primase catalytic subunit
MRFTVTEIRHYYNNLELPEGLWRWSRKHYRLETLGCHWVKLNRREDRIRAEELRGYLVRYAPRHVYMSVMDYLRPQYVGSRRKTRAALPLQGSFVVDVDSYQRARGHETFRLGVA